MPTTRSRPLVAALLTVTLLALVLAACGSETDSDGDGTRDAEVAAPASPFTVDRVPEGYVVYGVGEGEREQDWDTDWGSDEPFVLLGNGDQRVKISAMGDREGGPVSGVQVAGTRPGSPPWNVSGRHAGDGFVLQASSTDVDVDELDRLLAATSPEGRRSAPSVADLPGGWEVVGSSDADVVMSIGSATGPTGAYGTMWSRGDVSIDNAPMLSAVSLPGHVADIEAWTGDILRPLSWFGDAHGKALTVDGRPVAFVVVGEGEGTPLHVLLTRQADGSLFVLTSSGNGLLSKEQLIDVLSSVRPATEQEWEELGWSTWGGPDLRPDDGAVEVTRGEEDGTDWLLQATRTPRPGGGAVLGDLATGWQVRTCLKLKGGKEACASSQTGEIAWSDPEPTGLPPFYVVSTSLPGAAVRVTTPSGSQTGQLHGLPNGSMRVAVVFAELDGPMPVCSEFEAPPSIDGQAPVVLTTLDVVDAAGEFIGCPGSIFSPPP